MFRCFKTLGCGLRFTNIQNIILEEGDASKRSSGSSTLRNFMKNLLGISTESYWRATKGAP